MNKDLANNQIGNPNDYSANYWLANATSYSGTDFAQGTDLEMIPFHGDTRTRRILHRMLKIRLPWGIPACTLDQGAITVLAARGNPNSA